MSMCAKRSDQYYEDLLVRIPMGDAIPKDIYQIFIGADIYHTSSRLVENIEFIKQTNAEYTHRLFDDRMIREFILEHYGVGIWRYYAMISPSYRAARADFFRYLLIYRLGGVYMDIKASFYSPLRDNLLATDKYILYHWDNDPEHGRYPWVGHFADLPRDKFPYGEFPQGFIISVAGHPFLRATILQTMKLLDAYTPFRNPTGLKGVLQTTGPIMYSKVIGEMLESIEPSLYRHIRCAEDIGLRVSIFDNESRVAHRKVYSTYHDKVTAVSRNGSHYWTYLLYPYFKWRWIHQILKDKARRGEGPYTLFEKFFSKQDKGSSQ